MKTALQKPDILVVNENQVEWIMIMKKKSNRRRLVLVLFLGSLAINTSMAQEAHNYTYSVYSIELPRLDLDSLYTAKRDSIADFYVQSILNRERKDLSPDFMFTDLDLVHANLTNSFHHIPSMRKLILDKIDDPKVLEGMLATTAPFLDKVSSKKGRERFIELRELTFRDLIKNRLEDIQTTAK